MELMKNVVMKNSTQLTKTNTPAANGEMIPLGNSLSAVRLLALSYLLSIRRLNPIAALLAKTIQSTTFNNKNGVNDTASFVAIKYPIIAKGNANMVCENFMKLR